MPETTFTIEVAVSYENASGDAMAMQRRILNLIRETVETEERVRQLMAVGCTGLNITATGARPGGVYDDAHTLRCVG